MYLRSKYLTENRHKFYKIKGNACPLTAPIKAQLKTAFCQETELFLLRSLLAVVVSLKNSDKLSEIHPQVIISETTTSGQHTISTSHTCKCICSNIKWGKERFSFHMKFQFFGSKPLQELFKSSRISRSMGKVTVMYGLSCQKNNQSFNRQSSKQSN